MEHGRAFKSLHGNSYFQNGLSGFHDTGFLYRLSFICILRMHEYVNIILLIY